MNSPKTQDLLEWALYYDSLDWCVIPIKPGTKEAAVLWTPFQTRRPTEDELHKWFDPPCRFFGLAVVLGAPSGGLAAADFDVPGSYDQWAEVYFNYANHIPTDKGARGSHVFFRLPKDSPIVKASTKTPYGDLLAHEHYVVLPPSRHPTGINYSWIVASNHELIEIEPEEIGLGPTAADLSAPTNGEALTLGPSVSQGTRNNLLFRYASGLRDKGLTLEEIVASVRILNQSRCAPPMENDEVMTLCRSASRYTPKHPLTRVNYHLTELGNAKRFVAQHGHKVRFVSEWRKWIVWDGTRWKPDDTHEVLRLMKSTVEEIYESAHPRNEMTDDERKAMVKWAFASEADQHIRASLHLAESEQDIPVTVNALDADHRLLNCRNGTIELPTLSGEVGVLRPHRQEDMITKICRASYDPDADYSEFATFLGQTFRNDPDLEMFFQRAAGYAATGLIREHGLFILYGTGRNGKTTLMETLSHVLGDYAARTPIETLIGRSADRNEGASPNLAALKGTRLVIAAEPEHGRWLRESQVKILTGGDTLTARQLYQAPVTFTPTFKIFIIANHKPRVSGTDKAIWERIHLIPFNNYVPLDQRILDLQEKLTGNPDPILTWIVGGCSMWAHCRLGSCAAVAEMTDGYRHEMDVVQQFLDARCVQTPISHCESTALFKLFQAWSIDNGEAKMTQTAFSLRLKELGFTKERTKAGITWNGIGILEV